MRGDNKSEKQSGNLRDLLTTFFCACSYNGSNLNAAVKHANFSQLQHLSGLKWKAKAVMHVATKSLY